MYIGADMGGTFIKLGLLTDDLRPVARLKVPTESMTSSGVVMKNLLAGLHRLMTENQVTPNDIQAIGLGVPGQMDIQHGLSIASPNFSNWANVPVVTTVQQAYHIPTFMDNDVRVNLYGEWQFGAGRGKQDVLMVTLGTGLGAAMITNGRMMYGTTNSAVELGHMNMVRHGGRPCACGSSGCFGRYVSARGMVATVSDHLQRDEKSIVSQWTAGDLSSLTAEQISTGYDQHDAVCVATMRETSEMLGFGLANAINLYNPARVIIGGGVAQAGERLLGPARAIVTHHALKVAREACDVVPAELGPWAGMTGAAVYAQVRAVQQAGGTDN